MNLQIQSFAEIFRKGLDERFSHILDINASIFPGCYNKSPASGKAL